MENFEAARRRMVEEQIAARGVADERILEAMREVPRHLFVPERLRDRAYQDAPLPIGNGQTISQPYIVAAMCEALRVGPESRVLEIGTGSGYQAAVLASVAAEVVTVEIVETLLRRSRRLLKQLGYDNVVCRQGDGSTGAADLAPFDAIVLAAATPSLPEAVLDQLADGGRLVFPEGSASGYQELVRLERRDGRVLRTVLMPVRFVPLTGKGR